MPTVITELNPYRPNRLAAMKPSWLHCKAFDATTRYEPRPEVEPSFSALQRFLALTIYNPASEFEVDWRISGECSLSEIVAEVERGLEKDDDIIQQWFGAEDVLKLLRSATSFDEMVDRVRCVCGEFEVDLRLKEIVTTILGPDPG